ncbi:TRAP transporter small permease [Cloacibacillus evryensis]|uniref:TRAP transporter small permease n=1 Tax=Cloacibacillus evryensis TaxID=508460 RepID=UPI003AB7DE48
MLRWLDDHLEEFLMAVLLLLITVIISYSVVMRYVFNDSPTWAEEITRFFFIWSAFLSIGLCIRRQSSIRIDILLTAITEKQRNMLLAGVNLFVIIVMAYWLYGAVNVTRTLMSNGQTSPALLVPMWVIYGSSVVGFSLAIFRSAQQFLINIKGGK